MEIFFTDSNFKIGGHPFSDVPFFVDSEYKLLDNLNEFFTKDLLIDGRINSPKTWESYAYWLKDFLEWTNANSIDWKSANSQEVMAYRNWSLETCELSPKTVNARISVIKRFYNYAVQVGLVKSNPVTESQSKFFVHVDANFLSHTHKLKLKRNDLSVKVSHELPKIFSDQDIKRLFNAATSDRLKLMMRLMLECGLRREEVANLPANVVEDAIRAAQQMGANSEVPFYLPASICKGNKGRTVILSYPTAMKLMQYRATIRPKYVKLFKAKKKADPSAFWLTRLGTAYRTESLSTDISNLGKKAGVMGAHPHKFRHTFATTLYAITGDLRLVQKLLGHEHIQTTTIYEHTAAVDKMGFFADYQKQVDAMINERVD